MPAAKSATADGSASAPAADAVPTTTSATAAVAIVGLAKLLASESEAALMSRDEAKASILPTLSQRVQELLVVLPSAIAATDPASDLGAALAALSTILN